jgi:2-(1,2-epoxy-1,2-dihydrophenyl)acetyl-CoA isomerase
MSEYENILYSVQDSVATIILNRPDKYNAFTVNMIKEITHAFKAAGRDEQVRAILLTGTGKAFAAGQDIGAMVGEDSGKSFKEHIRTSYNPMIMTMRSLEKPIIGAINGVAAGAGLSTALACDIRLASSNASFVFAAFVNLGLVPDSGLTYFLPRVVGPAKAFELITLASGDNRVTAEQSVELGLCRAVVEPEKLMAEANALAAQFASMATRAVGMTKRMLNASWHHSLEEMLEMEAQVQQGAVGTEDVREGIAAFLEKRQPSFSGK